MGYSLAWVGVNGVAYEDIVARLALTRTGENAEYFESPVAGRLLPDGWAVVVARGCNHQIIHPSALAKLSVSGQVVACSVEEHVMFSACELWVNGVRQWRVAHDAQESIQDLTASGALPEDFASTRAAFAEQQAAEGGEEADVDMYFEIPLVLARNRVGFKHDEVNGTTDDERFEVLLGSSKRPPAGAGRPWWRFWR